MQTMSLTSVAKIKLTDWLPDSKIHITNLRINKQKAKCQRKYKDSFNI